MKFFRHFFYVYIMIFSTLFSCIFVFPTARIPKDADGAFEDIISTINLSATTSGCSLFDTQVRNSDGTTETSRSQEIKISKEYKSFWANDEGIPESFKESLEQKSTVTKSGSYKIRRFPGTIVYQYENYGNSIGITGLIVCTEVDERKKTMNVKGILEISGPYTAKVEIRYLKINNKPDNSYCGKVESLENQSDFENWSIYVQYKNPKTEQITSEKFNESNKGKEKNRILLENLLKRKKAGEDLFNF